MSDKGGGEGQKKVNKLKTILILSPPPLSSPSQSNHLLVSCDACVYRIQSTCKRPNTETRSCTNFKTKEFKVFVYLADVFKTL